MPDRRFGVYAGIAGTSRAHDELRRCRFASMTHRHPVAAVTNALDDGARAGYPAQA